MLPRLYNTGATAVRVRTGGERAPLKPGLALRNDSGNVGEGGKCDASNLLPFPSPEGDSGPFFDESVPATERRILENEVATESRRLLVVGLRGGFNSSPVAELLLLSSVAPRLKGFKDNDFLLSPTLVGSVNPRFFRGFGTPGAPPAALGD